MEKCEYVVLEVGLGGRYDATNIIKKPLVTAITNIGLDHTQILGNTRAEIARDKAGIIKKNSDFFTSEDDPKILSIFEKQCTHVGAKYSPLNVKGLDYSSRNRLLAGSICSALGVLNDPLDIVDNIQLPARFEIVKNKPLVIIDGAHNPSKIMSTVDRLQALGTSSGLKYKNLSLVIAISSDKDWETMMKIICPMARKIYVTRFSVPGRQAVDPKLLYLDAKKYVGADSVKLFSDPVQAFNAAVSKLGPSDAVLVTGSFYLAGDIRALYCPEEKILENRSSKI